jgi:general secretion pathway protein B
MTADAESKSPSAQQPLSAGTEENVAEKNVPEGNVSSALPLVAEGNATPRPAPTSSPPDSAAEPANEVLQAEALPAEPVKPKTRPRLARKSAENRQARPAASSGPVSATGQAPAPASDSPPEARVATLRELPENIQREIPALTIGGYIYSNNQSERSVLINKRLLHEGDEVAPGLVLEKMLPKEAVLSYKGHRYRISY